MSEQALHPAVQRIVREHGARDILALLGQELSGADLTALLIEVMHRRAAALSPADVLAAYERDRFVRPAAVDARRLVEVELAALDAVVPPFLPVATSPLAPLGTHSVVAGVNQNRVVATVRRSEVAADPTTSLALEAAVRRRRLLASDRRSSAIVHLASVDRVVRAQQFDGPLSFPHFTLLGLVSAGRDTGSRSFELAAMRAHLHALLRVTDRLGFPQVTIDLTDFGGRHGDVLQTLMASVTTDCTQVSAWPERTAARGYYPNLCFRLSIVSDGETIEVGDGGIVTWTQSLVESRKERLMTSGLSLERLALISAGPVIRRGTPDDAIAAAEVWLRSRKAAVPAIPEPRHTDDEVRHHFQTVVVMQRELWLAVDDSDAHVTGLLVLDGADVDQLYVDPERWGRGIGSGLMEHAKQLRPQGLWLWTFQTNTGARRFYERHGFVVVDETDGSGNEERAPDVRYAWRP